MIHVEVRMVRLITKRPGLTKTNKEPCILAAHGKKYNSEPGSCLELNITRHWAVSSHRQQGLLVSCSGIVDIATLSAFPPFCKLLLLPFLPSTPFFCGPGIQYLRGRGSNRFINPPSRRKLRLGGVFVWENLMCSVRLQASSLGQTSTPCPAAWAD